jgi:hypothetical protein
VAEHKYPYPYRLTSPSDNVYFQEASELYTVTDAAIEQAQVKTIYLYAEDWDKMTFVTFGRICVLGTNPAIFEQMMPLHVSSKRKNSQYVL